VLPALAGAGERGTATERAGLVSSQLLGFALCRYILKLPPAVAMTEEQIVKHLGPTLQRYATGVDGSSKL